MFISGYVERVTLTLLSSENKMPINDITHFGTQNINILLSFFFYFPQTKTLNKYVTHTDNFYSSNNFLTSIQQPGCRKTEDSRLFSNTDAISNVSQTMSHTHPFNGPFSGTTRVSRYQKGKTYLDFTEARNRERQWQALAGPHASLHLAPDR